MTATAAAATMTMPSDKRGWSNYFKSKQTFPQNPWLNRKHCIGLRPALSLLLLSLLLLPLRRDRPRTYQHHKSGILMYNTNPFAEAAASTFFPFRSLLTSPRRQHPPQQRSEGGFEATGQIEHSKSQQVCSFFHLSEVPG